MQLTARNARLLVALYGTDAVLEWEEDDDGKPDVGAYVMTSGGLRPAGNRGGDVTRLLETWAEAGGAGVTPGSACTTPQGDHPPTLPGRPAHSTYQTKEPKWHVQM